MCNVAILGFGTVGSGVFEILQKNSSIISKRAGEEIVVKYILDVRDFSKSENANLFTKDFDKILNDKDVKVVVETIGGVKYAYNFVKQSLLNAKNVVTSNKELVATHGSELLEIAKHNNVSFMFEASVGGGTPIIMPLHNSLSANNVYEINGIVNGTTNFMLTKMADENMSFDEALKLAQNLGYAETIDPSADVDGIDAGRKIAILSSIASGKEVKPNNINTVGIRNVTVNDIANAKKINSSIKLIAWCKKDENDNICAGVEPMVIPNNNLLSCVNGVFNAIAVKGDMVGEVVFYGQGAGKLATASAVVSDIIDGLKNKNVHDTLYWEKTEAVEKDLSDNSPSVYYIAVENLKDNALLSGYNIINEKEVAFLTDKIDAKGLLEVKEKINNSGAKILTILKYLD